MKNRRTVQVGLSSASFSVSGPTQQDRIRGAVGRMLECGVKQEVQEVPAGTAAGGSDYPPPLVLNRNPKAPKGLWRCPTSVRASAADLTHEK